jgi:hypothetical protein
MEAARFEMRYSLDHYSTDPIPSYQTIVLAANMRMSLGIMRVLGPSNPALLSEIASSLTTLLSSQKNPMSLRGLPDPSVMRDVLDGE